MLNVNSGRLTIWMPLGALFVLVILWGGCNPKQSVKVSEQAIKDLPAKATFDLIQKNKDNLDFVVLDVRTPGEFSDGHIENAINVDYNSETFRKELEKLDKSKTYLMHCRSGNRSSKAIPTMEELGFLKVYHMDDGMNGWKAEGFPVVVSP